VIHDSLREVWRKRGTYAFIAPSLALFTTFVIVPTFWTVYVSFFRWNIAGGSAFLGLDNYVRLPNDSLFLVSFQKTVLFSLSITVFSVLLGFVAAMLVDEMLGPLKYIARSSIFVPTIASLIMTAMIWRILLEPKGVVQSGVGLFGIQTRPWLGDPRLAVLSVILMSSWQRTGYNMVFFLAGLQTIPDVFYEAADVDGASSWSKFRYITIPLLQRTTLFIIVINTIANFKIFEQVFGLTGGGPMNSTMTLMVNIYNVAFGRLRYGQAAAQAVVFSLIAFGIAALQMRMLRSEVEY